jgi:hypothetical protein
MSANLDVKDISVKNSISEEELLIERYDYTNLYLRLLKIIPIFFLTIPTFIVLFFIFNYSKSLLDWQKGFLFVLPSLTFGIALVIGRELENKLLLASNKIKREIISNKLMEKYSYDNSLKEKIESFYIELNYLTEKQNTQTSLVEHWFVVIMYLTIVIFTFLSVYF